MSSFQFYSDLWGKAYQHPPGPYGSPWTADLARLRSEKDFLENKLANCVTYLQVFRKKRAENERLLTTDPRLPRRKRKKLQQEIRELDKRIKNDEREEQAFLNNLQACKTNLYIAGGMHHPSYASTTTLPDCAASTQSESTETSWNGWSDSMSISPFEKPCQNPFFADEVPPDGLVQDPMRVETFKPPPLWIPDTDEVANMPVPPNSAQSFYMNSALSPTAAEFKPMLPPHEEGLGNLIIELPQLNPSTPIHDLRPRRSTHVGCSPSYENGLPLIDTNWPFQIPVASDPQRSPYVGQQRENRRRSRTNSL